MTIEKGTLWLNKFGNLEVTQDLADFSGCLAVFTARDELHVVLAQQLRCRDWMSCGVSQTVSCAKPFSPGFLQSKYSRKVGEISSHLLQVTPVDLKAKPFSSFNYPWHGRLAFT